MYDLWLRSLNTKNLCKENFVVQAKTVGKCQISREVVMWHKYQPDIFIRSLQNLLTWELFSCMKLVELLTVSVNMYGSSWISCWHDMTCLFLPLADSCQFFFLFVSVPFFLIMFFFVTTILPLCKLFLFSSSISTWELALPLMTQFRIEYRQCNRGKFCRYKMIWLERENGNKQKVVENVWVMCNQLCVSGEETRRGELFFFLEITIVFCLYVCGGDRMECISFLVIPLLLFFYKSTFTRFSEFCSRGS